MADPNPAEAKAVPGAVTVKDTVGAPVIYFDGAPNFGCNNGIINVTLAVARYLASGDGGVTMDIVAAAHLRCSIQAAVDLRNALDNALLLGAPAAGGGQAH